MRIEEIKHIADIAQIDFSEEELQNFEKKFTDTLLLIENIKSIDTEDIEKVFQLNGTKNNTREDKIKESLKNSEATKNTASEKYGYFKLIKFVD